MAVSTRDRAWLLGPLLVAGVALGLATWAWAAVAVLMLAAIPSLWVSEGWEWSHRVQLLTAGAAAAAALVVGPAGAPSVVFPPGGTAALHPLAERISLAFLAIAVLRRYVRNPFGGTPASLLALAASLAASGYAPWNITYTVLVAAFALASAPALRAAPGGGPAWHCLDQKRKLAGVAMLLLAASFASIVAAAIPVLHKQFVSAFLRYEGARSESGLADSILLGGATDIAESDQVVLRIHGGRTDYLRGFVLTRYQHGAWLPSDKDLGAERPASRPGPAPAIEITTAKVEPRYYLPLHAKHVTVDADRVVVDRMGLVRALSGSAAGLASFELGERDAWPVAPPDAQDLEVPDAVRPALQQVVKQWSADASSPQARMERLERRLRADFRYSLQHERRTREDPVLDFLLVHRVGHCEYFASALALLARASGIPARVVSGYRVHESNPLGGYGVVRARDAHAWVEAWVDGEGWVTFDPTPPSAFEANESRTSWFGVLTDAAVDGFERAVRSEAVGPGRVVAVLGGAGLLGLGVLWLRRRGAVGRVVRRHAGSDVTSLPMLAELIGKRGHTRLPSETLEAFAARITQGGGDKVLEEAGELLRSYARFRYGGIGDRIEIDTRMRALCARAKTGGG